MQVSISKAASMVGITRATLYRHIKKKDITVGKDSEGNPKIDVSELIRVYGDQVRTDGKKKPAQTAASNDTVATASHTPSPKPKSIAKPKTKAEASELEVLRERVKFYEEERANWKNERRREREQLLEQVENLRTILNKSQEQQHRLTALLTDQRSQSQKNVFAANANDQARQIELIQDTMQRLENQNKRIAFELQREKNKKFFKRVFG